jgi:hypothetical protein
LHLLSTLKNIPLLKDPSLNSNNVIDSFNTFNISNNMNYKSWGEVVFEKDNFIIVKNDNYLYHIHIYEKDNFNKIEIIDNKIKTKNNIVLTFEDHNPKFFITNSKFYKLQTQNLFDYESPNKTNEKSENFIIKNIKKVYNYFTSFFVNSVDTQPIETCKEQYKELKYVPDGKAKLERANRMENNLFVRTINNSEIYIDNDNEKIILKTIKTKTEYLKTKVKEKFIKNNFITFDIETMVINNEHIPYCICYSDENKNYSFYVTDYIDYNDMIKNVILSLLKPKYSGYNIYVHNLSNFDGIFLFSTLAELTGDSIQVIPLLRDGKFIDIKIKFGKNFKFNISFRDSYLLLPLSLAKLSKQFSIDHLKTSFPHKFLNNKYNENLDLNYVGDIPDLNYFEDFSKYTSFIEVYFKEKNSLSN